MKVPLYILGILLRFGPQHGYQIKKIFAEQLSDFAQIKLPTIYYHLEKMGKDGLLNGNTEKESNHPEKIIYSITDKGKVVFRQYINKIIQFEYQPEFLSDAVFYFLDAVNPSELKVSLTNYIENMRNRINKIKKHRTKELKHLPEEAKKWASIIFIHHEHHYQAELDWAIRTLVRLESE
jgi:DNA-binding PadR family transcriptional regulator